MDSVAFAGFEDREEKLKKIYRFSMFEVFFYRSSLWDHVQRVALIIKELSPLALRLLPNFDAEKAYVLALVHDDAEMITGDVQLGHKQRMSSEELKQVDLEEAKAVDILSEQYPKEITRFIYRDLLLNALHKDTLEAKLVSYADKLDAYCESMHEALAGNITALRPLLMYEKILDRFDEKYPELISLLQDQSSPFTNLEQRLNLLYVFKGPYLHLNRPHTPKTITLVTDFPTYNRWKKLVLEHFAKGTKLLTHQKESF